jgi:glycosyltransferase involved in cell wall biosynthesis
MSIDVSVIVPTYNTGEYLDKTMQSLVGQSLDPERYEVIAVDDGSTDETPSRLDALAGANRQVRVFHEANSGWSGRPRNVGLDNARGDFVFFCDHDDWLARGALERMVDQAHRTNADIVIPKTVGHGRGVPRDIFYRTPDASEDESPRPTLLMSALSPHKMFRRAMIESNGLRFPEGKRRLEDHLFVTQAYFAASLVSVVRDFSCYHHLRRSDAGNAIYTPLEPVSYYGFVRETIEVIEANTTPGPERDDFLERPYLVEMLGRTGLRGFRESAPEHRRLLFSQMRQLLVDAFEEEYDERFGCLVRARAAATRADRLDLVEALNDSTNAVKVTASVLRSHWSAGQLELEVEARPVDADGVGLQVTSAGELGWLPPPGLIPDQLTVRPDSAEALQTSPAHVVLVNRVSSEEWLVPSELTLQLDDEGDPQRRALVFRGRVQLDPRTVGGGRLLARGIWDLNLRCRVFGGRYHCRVTASGDAVAQPAVLTQRGVSVIPYTSDSGLVSVDVGEFRRTLLSEVLSRGLGPWSRARDGLDVSLSVHVQTETVSREVPALTVYVDGEARAQCRASLDLSATPVVLHLDRPTVLEAGTKLPKGQLTAGFEDVGRQGMSAVGIVSVDRRGRLVDLQLTDITSG